MRGVARRVVLAVVVATVGCGPMNDAAAPTSNAGAPGQSGVIIHLGDATARYPIRLTWPAVVGQRGRVRAESDDVRTTKLDKDGASKVETKHPHVSLNGVYEVLAVDADGVPTRVAMDSDRLEADFDDGTDPIVLEDTRVEIERAVEFDEPVLTIGGKRAGAGIERAVDEVVPLAESETATDDEIFGTREPQPIGGRWPVRAGVAREGLIEQTMKVQPGGVQGEMQLVSVLEHDGIECLELTSTLEVNPFELVDLPPGARVERGEIRVVTHSIVPTIAMPRLEDEMTMTTDLALTAGEAFIQTVGKKHTKSTYLPLPDRADITPP